MWSRKCVVLLALSVEPAFAGGDSPVDKFNAEAATASVNITQVRGGISVLTGSGGNIVVLSGKEGLFLVDTGIAVSRKQVESALRSVSRAPIRYAVDTHYHWDHSDGNAWLRELGATIIAHENTFARLSRGARVDDWDYTFAPRSVAGLPTQLIGTDSAMTFDGTGIQIKYYGPSHTDTDVWVYFERQDVLVTGDTFWNGVFPFIDNQNGGSVDGMIRAATDSIARAGERTLIVPGHGPIANRGQLVEFRNMLVEVRRNVADLKARGLSREAVIAARPTAKFDGKWGGFAIDGAFFTKLVYDGLP